MHLKIEESLSPDELGKELVGKLVPMIHEAITRSDYPDFQIEVSKVVPLGQGYLPPPGHYQFQFVETRPMPGPTNHTGALH